MNARRMAAGAAAALALVALGGYGFFWRPAERRAAWTASVAPPPALGDFPTELNARVQSLTTRAQSQPGDIAALGELGRLYDANGFAHEAAQAYAGLLRFDPRNALWPHLLAHLLAGNGRLAEAVPLWRRASELAPDYVPARLRLGEALLKTNDPAAAAAVYAAALQHAPDDPYALLGLARCELQLDHWTTAREHLQQAARAHPDFGVAWNLLATVYERLGNGTGAATAQARAEGTRRFRELADPWVDALLADCYDVYRLRVAASAATNSGDPRDALPWIERAGQLAPKDPAVLRQWGDTFAELRDFARAREYFQRACELAPADDANYLQWISACEAAGDSAGAARALAAGLDRCPESAGLQFAAGRRLASAGHAEEALTAFNAVRRLQPETAAAYLEIATIHFRAGRDALGVAALEDALAHAPDHVPTLLALAQHALESNDAAAAAQWLDRARAHAPAGQADAVETLARDFQRRFGRRPW